MNERALKNEVSIHKIIEPHLNCPFKMPKQASPGRSQARVRGCALKRNGDRYMLPRSPRSPTTMRIQQGRTGEITTFNRSKDYVSIEGTVLCLLMGSWMASDDTSLVSRLQVAPFRAGLQMGSSPSEYPDSFQLLVLPWLLDI